MKKNILFLCSLVIVAAAQAQSADSLVAWYPFNGNANDESGNGHNGTMTDTKLTKDRCDEPNSAMNFPYKTSRILLNNTGNLNISGCEFSIILWFKRFDYFGVVFGGPIITNYYYPDHDTGFYLDMKNHGTFDFVVNRSTVHSNRPLPDYAWHMVAVVADKQMLFLYLDGELMDSVGYTIPPANKSDLCLGRMDYDNFYNGFLDDIRIYKRAVKQQELLSFYDEKPFPVKIFQQPENKTLCLHDSMALIVRAAGSHPIHYQWRKEEIDIPGSDQNVLSIPITVAADSGNYRCTVSNSLDTVVSQSASIKVLFPVITSIMGKTVVKVNETAVYSVPRYYGHYYRFCVTGGDATDSTENSITVLWSVAGHGSVKMVETVSWMCNHDTLTLPVSVGSSGLELGCVSGFKVWPNPTSDRVTFSYQLESDRRVRITLFNSLGKEIKTPFDANQQPGQCQVEMDIRDLPAGMYFYRIQEGNNSWSGKIVKN